MHFFDNNTKRAIKPIDRDVKFTDGPQIIIHLFWGDWFVLTSDDYYNFNLSFENNNVLLTFNLVPWIDRNLFHDIIHYDLEKIYLSFPVLDMSTKTNNILGYTISRPKIKLNFSIEYNSNNDVSEQNSVLSISSTDIKPCLETYHQENIDGELYLIDNLDEIEKRKIERVNELIQNHKNIESLKNN